MSKMRDVVRGDTFAGYAVDDEGEVKIRLRFENDTRTEKFPVFSCSIREDDSFFAAVKDDSPLRAQWADLCNGKARDVVVRSRLDKSDCEILVGIAQDKPDGTIEVRLIHPFYPSCFTILNGGEMAEIVAAAVDE